MSEGDHGLHHAVAPGVTRDETRNTFDEAGSSSEAKRWHSTVRSRECRRRKKLGLQTRTIRIAPKQVTKLIEQGYLGFESRGDAKAEAIAIEAYLPMRRRTSWGEGGQRLRSVTRLAKFHTLQVRQGPMEN